MTINIYKTPNVMPQSLPSPQNTELREVLENYVAGLQDLTDSAKVPINILTMVAEENKIVASDIVRIIEARLQTAPPEHRLSTLHLLDSIIKNVKEPYLSLFAQNIIANFITTFNVVNIKTQESMIRLLQTWKEIYPIHYAQISTIIASRSAPPAISRSYQPIGSPFGSLPLPNSVQPIQENIPNQNTNRIPSPLPAPLLSPSFNLQSTFPFPGQMANVTTAPAQSFPQPNQNEILKQLYDRLREQLYASQIATLQSNAPQNVSSPSYTSIHSSTHSSHPSTHHPTHSYSAPSDPNDYIAVQPKQSQRHSSRYKQKSKNSRRSPTHSSHRSPTHSPTHSSNRSPNQSPTRSPSYSSARSPSHPSIRSPTHSSHSSFSQRTHLVDLKDQTNIDNKNISIGTSFSGDALRRKQPHIINNLYNASWSQCPSCTFRFADTNKLSDHLDWHFKMNRREKEKYKKPLSREWFVPADEWITYEYFETLQKPSSGGGFFDTETSAEEIKEQKKVKTIVKVDGHGVTCPICSEGFESFYDSEEDEWMYKDAVEINGVLYHDDCSPDHSFEGLGKRYEHPTSDRDFPYKLSKLDS